MTATLVCRHGHTLIQGCQECLGPDDWHYDIMTVGAMLAHRARTRTVTVAAHRTTAAVVVEVLTPSRDGTFGYRVTVRRDGPDDAQPSITTELERFTGPVRDWPTLQAQANDRCAFYAHAFGLARFDSTTQEAQ